jgi:hypothetical protein
LWWARGYCYGCYKGEVVEIAGKEEKKVPGLDEERMDVQ